MIRKIQRHWFEVWGDEEAQNRFLKYLLIVVCLVSSVELVVIGCLAMRKPILISVSPDQTRWNVSAEPDPTLLMKELSRAIQQYLKLRHSWEWTTIDTKTRGASGYIAPEFKEKFFISLQEQIRIAKEKQVSQKLYPEEPQIDLKAKTATIQAERILIVSGLRASQPMTFQLSFEMGNRSETNPEGVYITDEKVLNPN